MKLKEILYIFTVFSICVYVITFTGITVNHTKEIEHLNNRLDSIITNDNYSYTHITTFEYKTPEEGIDEALIY